MESVLYISLPLQLYICSEPKVGLQAWWSKSGEAHDYVGGGR